MPKIVCHMANGFEFAHSEARCRVPAKPTELELEQDWQVRVLRADCRVVVLEGGAPHDDPSGEIVSDDASGDVGELEEPAKPITRMNRSELQDVARELGIEPEQTKKQLLAEIKNAS